MKRKSSVVGGIILILLGLFFLAREIFPGYFQFLEWPFIIIGIGLAFLIWAILSGTGGLAVPAAILGGIGALLYYQNATQDWTSWAYAWALIPGFVGIGIMIGGIIDKNYRDAFTGGLTLIMISALIFFAVGEPFGLAPDISKYWPVLLIGLGVIALVRALFSAGKKKP